MSEKIDLGRRRLLTAAGEGDYDRSEWTIQRLLNTSGEVVSVTTRREAAR